MLKDLLHIIGVGFKDMAELEKSGQKWVKDFQKKGFLKPGQRILDFGAGLGRISIPFSKVCKEVVAIDGNPEMVAYLQKAGVNATLGTDCTGVTGKFDFIITAYVLQHMIWDKAIDLVGQFSKLTDTLFFTFPTHERCNADVNKRYLSPEAAKDLPVTESHNYSRILYHKDLYRLFVKSDFDIKTLEVLYTGSNLFKIIKG